jgi:cytochrome c5
MPLMRRLMRRHLTLLCVCAMTVGAAVWTGAQERKVAGDSSSTSSSSSTSTTPATSSSPSSTGAVSVSHAASHGVSVARKDAAARAEGEKRFRANCERCHAAPEKFPPRMMTTIVRHMRVRAYITEEDARLILNYMSQ